MILDAVAAGGDLAADRLEGGLVERLHDLAVGADPHHRGRLVWPGRIARHRRR